MHPKLLPEIGLFETSYFFIAWMVVVVVVVVVVVDGWDTEAFLDVKKNNLFGNISESTRQVFLIVSTPHRRVLKTSLGMFRIGKIGNVSNKKISKLFF